MSADWFLNPGHPTVGLCSLCCVNQRSTTLNDRLFASAVVTAKWLATYWLKNMWYQDEYSWYPSFMCAPYKELTGKASREDPVHFPILFISCRITCFTWKQSSAKIHSRYHFFLPIWRVSLSLEHDLSYFLFFLVFFIFHT